MIIDTGRDTRSLAVRVTGDWAEVRSEWHRVFTATPGASFFVSPEWVDAWIATFAGSLQPRIVTFSAGGVTRALCIVVRRLHWYGPVPVRRLFINTSGEKDGSPVVEFNALVCEPGWESSVVTRLHHYIDELRWDEIAFDGFSSGCGFDAVKSEFAGFAVESQVSQNYFVDLAHLRAEQKMYEEALGPKTRKHLRQSYRTYGNIVTEAAGTKTECLAFLEELAVLHQQRWTSAGHQGAFASQLFKDFHIRLIDAMFDNGGIQLLKFSVEGKPIGLMYNIVNQGNVYFYQCGLVYGKDKRVRPGAVCIGKCVQYCLEQSELLKFHLMATGDHYKERMGTHAEPIEWLLVRKRNARYYVVNSLRAAKRRLQGHRTATVEHAGHSEAD
jgi:CelD/BcsL family acetyltransferase involved in cellulose biosynthesis